MTAADPTPRPASDVVTAAEAARLLGVKPATLYAYVSRGLLRSRHSPGSRLKRYARADVLRLKANADARKGHDAAAREALDWGAPVIESAITLIDDDGLWYRGLSPSHFWIHDDDIGDPFAACAHWLCRGRFEPELVEAPLFEHPTRKGVLVPDGPAWLDPDMPSDEQRAASAVVARVIRRLAWARPPSSPRQALDLVLSAWRLAGPAGVLDDDSEWQKAKALLGHLSASPALLKNPADFRDDEPLFGQALRRALGVSADVDDVLWKMLILMADHELNASTFAARVAASTGADVATCLSAAFAVVSGPGHGATCDRVEALLDEVGTPERAARVVAGKLHRGEPLPGFGHRLYRGGDPRAAVLLALPEVRNSPAAAVAYAVIDAWQKIGGDNPLTKPSVDLALVAAARALGLPAGMATALFALGRSAGWAAHVFEQRGSSQMLRPRARYTGPPPRPERAPASPRAPRQAPPRPARR